MTKFTRRAVLAGASAFAAMPALAKGTWPERAITLIHGFPPGGPVDTLSRILGEPLSMRLGWPVVIAPKPGATGTLAAALVTRAAPDGYTLLAVPATYTATAAMLRALPYEPVDGFTFISSTAGYPLVLVTHSDSEIRTLADLVRIARSRATPLQYGTAGVGSVMHLSMELFAKEANIRLQHVPYKGGAPAITDLLGKRIDLVLDPPTALMQHVAAGKLRALAVTAGERFFGLPEVPTMAESGYPDYVVTGYQGIAAPAGLPAAITKRLNAEIAAVVSDPKVVAQLKKVGNSPKPSTPEQYKARIAADIARWQTVVAERNIARI